MKYKDTQVKRIVPGRFIQGGDFVSSDGSGSATVYDSSTIPAEKNSLKFKEPYLLAAPANSEGQTGCQFMLTLDALPPLDGSDHTIFGRLISGRETAHMIEGVDELR